jgi:hypothetical protein
MKKTILLLSISMLAVITATAQHRFFITPGVSLAKADYSPADGITPKSQMGFDGGVGAEFKITKHFAIQPELNYSMQGMKIESNGTNASFKFNYITMPVLAKLQPIEGFSTFVGPQIGFLTSASAEYEGEPKQNAKGVLKALDVFGVFGMEYRFPIGVVVGARYQVGFRDIVGTPDIETEIKNSALTFRVGYSFPFSSAARKK